MPRVSVIVPAKDAARFIAESVESVVNQTYTDLECIVVDDGSADGTGDIVRAIADARVRCIRKENRGTVSDARNAGIRAATGELIAFLDADDVWLPRKLALQVAVFDERPEVGFVYCGYAITDSSLSPTTFIGAVRDPGFRRWLLLEGNGIAPSTTGVVRRDVADAVGGFRLELSVSEDLDFAARVAARCEVAAVDECLALYRTHPEQGHQRLDRFEHDMRWILADRFGPAGERDHRSWRRGMANLHTRLAVYQLRGGHRADARSHLGAALRHDAPRVVMLPAEAMVRRARRRLNRPG